MKVARRSAGGDWAIDVVTTEPGITKGLLAAVALAFDPVGNPALAYAVDVNPEVGWGEPEVVKFATLVDGSWQIEEVDVTPHSSFGMGIGAQLTFDTARGDFSILHSFDLVSTRYCFRGGGVWSCEESFSGEPPDFCQTAAYEAGGSCPLPRWLSIDGFGDALAAFQIGRSVRLARSIDGVTWTHEFVDGTGWRPEFQDAPTGINPTGPYLDLDPSGSPTLSWMWKRDDWQPGDLDLFFAWRTP